MFKAIKDNKIIAINDKEIKGCLVYDEMVEDTEHTVDDYEQYEGEYILKSSVPIEYQNEQIRLQRQARFATESDPLKLDYDEAVARGEETAEEKKRAWLTKKDEIRTDLPYVQGLPPLPPPVFPPVSSGTTASSTSGNG